MDRPLQIFVSGRDGQFANPLVVALVHYLAHCNGMQVEVEAVVDAKTSQIGNARVGAKLQRAYSSGWLPQLPLGKLVDEKEATRLFFAIPSIVSHLVGTAPTLSIQNSDLRLSTADPLDGFHEVWALGEADILASIWGAVDRKFLKQTTERLQEVMLTARQQLLLAEEDEREEDTDPDLPQVLGPHWAAQMDLGLGPDLEVLPLALKQAHLDLFSSLPETPWNRWLSACMTQGMMARLPECATMFAERNEDQRSGGTNGQ